VPSPKRKCMASPFMLRCCKLGTLGKEAVQLSWDASSAGSALEAFRFDKREDSDAGFLEASDLEVPTCLTELAGMVGPEPLLGGIGGFEELWRR
jgi:hypothetical protein